MEKQTKKHDLIRYLEEIKRKMFRSFQLTMEHPQFTFSTNTPDTTALANIYSQQWQQLNDYLLQLNQSNFQIHDPQPTETKERRTKVAKSDEAHTSPSHLETPQATQIEENTTKHNNTLGKGLFRYIIY